MHGPDSELVRRSREGDVVAYAELMRRHRHMAYVVAQRILGCADDAEDVVQEAFVCAYRGIGGFRQDRAFAPWMRRITTNCAVNQLRQREREARCMASALADPATVEAPDGRVLTIELQAQVRRAVDSLPLRQRLTVVLFYLDGMNVADIADTLGCSASTVKAQLMRGRQKLAQCLGGPLGRVDP